MWALAPYLRLLHRGSRVPAGLHSAVAARERSTATRGADRSAGHHAVQQHQQQPLDFNDVANAYSQETTASLARAVLVRVCVHDTCKHVRVCAHSLRAWTPSLGV